MLTSRDCVDLIRGLTLVGVLNGVPSKLAHFDTCGSGEVKDVVGLDDTFADKTDSVRDKYDSFLIAGVDSVVCGADSSALTKGLPVKQLAEISFRQPYLAKIDSDGDVVEITGESESVIDEEFIFHRSVQ